MLCKSCNRVYRIACIENMYMLEYVMLEWNGYRTSRLRVREDHVLL